MQDSYQSLLGERGEGVTVEEGEITLDPPLIVITGSLHSTIVIQDTRIKRERALI